MAYYGIIFIALLGIIRLVDTQYNIVKIESINDYSIVSETTTHTYTECILKCDHDDNCSSVSIHDNEAASLTCILLQEKRGNLNLSNHDEASNEKNVLTVKKIDDHITLLSHLHKNKMHGDWSEWKFTKCSTTCDQGTLQKLRSCDNPKPQHKGEKCQTLDGRSALEETVTEACNSKSCPVQQHQTEIDEGSTKTLECNPPPSQLIIVSAQYGSTTRVPTCLFDVLTAIRTECDGNYACSLSPSNSLAGDPCPNWSKHLYVTYKCQP